MKANKNLFVSARVDKETKEWINNQPLSTTQLINYGLYLIRSVDKKHLRSPHPHQHDHS